MSRSCIVAAAVFVALAPGNAWGGTLRVYYTTDKAETDQKPCSDGENQWDKVGDDNKLPETRLKKGECIWIACCNVVDGEKVKSFALRIYWGGGAAPALNDLEAKKAEGFPTKDDDRPRDGFKTTKSYENNSEKVLHYFWEPQPEWERFEFCATADINLKDIKIRAWSHCADEWRDPPQLNIRGGNFGAHGAVFGDPHIIQVLIFPQVVPVDPGFQPLFNAPPHTGVWRTGLTHFDPQGNHYPGGGYYFETDGPGLATGDLYDLTMTMMDDADMRYDLFAFEVESGEWQDYVLAAGQLGFHDDFDAYPLEENICGHGHWVSWDGRDALCARVTGEQSLTPPQSLRLNAIPDPEGDNVVRPLDIVGGVWRFETMVFVPAEAVGFAYVRFYSEFGARRIPAVLLRFDANLDVVTNTRPPIAQLPMVKDAWVPLAMVVDLDRDIVETWYDGQPLGGPRSWRGTGGKPWIQGFNLFAPPVAGGGISAMFFDDVRLSELNFGACCLDEIGVCEEIVEREECSARDGRFHWDTACADLDPPCGQHGCTRQPQWVCDGDVDGNGAVNPVDAGLVQAAFCSPGDCPEADLCQFDMDCNGAVNPVDAGIVQSLFGACNPPRPSCP